MTLDFGWRGHTRRNAAFVARSSAELNVTHEPYIPKQQRDDLHADG